MNKLSIYRLVLLLLLIHMPFSYVIAEDLKKGDFQGNIEQGVINVEGQDEDERGVIHIALMYLPNRVFDLLDIFRARIRVGPGLAIGARITEPISVYAGTYASVYGGLPGARMRKTPKLPIGLESFNGAKISFLDATISANIGPDYSPTEIGVGSHILILGLDIGFDPWELVDFAGGLLTLDVRDDDL